MTKHAPLAANDGVSAEGHAAARALLLAGAEATELASAFLDSAFNAMARYYPEPVARRRVLARVALSALAEASSHDDVERYVAIVLPVLRAGAQPLEGGR